MVNWLLLEVYRATCVIGKHQLVKIVRLFESLHFKLHFSDLLGNVIAFKHIVCLCLWMDMMDGRPGGSITCLGSFSPVFTLVFNCLDG